MNNINLTLSDGDYKVLCWALVVASLECTDDEYINIYCRLLSTIQDAGKKSDCLVK
jgi:hypothetical protein